MMLRELIRGTQVACCWVFMGINPRTDRQGQALRTVTGTGAENDPVLLWYALKTVLRKSVRN